MALVLSGSYAVGSQIDRAQAGQKNTLLSEKEIMQDAETAWLYFTSEVNRSNTGLVSAAVWPQKGGFGSYSILTMWDVGSVILAYISARSLGLIDSKEFDERITGVLGFLKKSSFRWNKLNLPNYRTGVVDSINVESGYDSTDIGRLLVALHILEKTTSGAYDIKKLISKWDIAGTIQNGKLFDIKSSKLIASESYNYIYYITRAHKLWGFDVDSGYEKSFDLKDVDARKAFLAHVAQVGEIASEPSTNEIIELGETVHARTLANELYQAQLERFVETGKLTCVSEAPIDKNPWFTYQAFNSSGTDWGRWPVHSVTTAKRWQTKKFSDTYRMVNSKAAFLWFAVRDDAYARKLRTHIRTNARSDQHGFLPGVYEASGKSPNIMDVNTNAMVLQSLAYVHAGRKPLCELKL